MIKQPFTEQQLSELFARMTPTVQIPPDARERQLCRVLAEARKLRQMRRRLHLRRAAVAVVALVMLAMTASGASAQVRCDPCRMRVLLPIIRVSEAVR